MVDQIFHFTIGPVQGFVSQARRTRDLWAGSFLLSWLAGQAIAAVFEQGGTITFPEVGTKDNPTDPLFRAIILKDGTPLIGSIPNRFKATVPAKFSPEAVRSRVVDKWQDLAAHVYQQYAAPTADKYGSDTGNIWNRQVNNFWEIAWLLGEDPGDRSDDHWLDMRKNWRNHWPDSEGGDHCTLMSDFQEISGYTRARDRNRQEKFWQAMQQAAPDGRLDIRDNERLCAIALIKRLFPRLGKAALAESIGWTPGGNEKTVGNWPSTTYMAVAPWLAHIAQDNKRISYLKEYIQAVHDTVNRDNNDYFRKLASEQATNLTMLAPLRQHTVAGKKLDDIDGVLLHHHALRNHRATFLSDQLIPPSGEDPEPAKRQELLNKLSKLYKIEKTGEKPRSCYALLLLDGDRLGKMLQEEDQQAVSRALLDFTNKVTPCINREEYSGLTIYAGGDDVLALLPMNNAIACAEKLHDTFVESFSKESIKDATASVALIFAHHQVPLRTVLAETHHQLEDIAKDTNGRDSLSLAVLKPSGVTATWVSCWQGKTSKPVTGMRKLIKLVAEKDFPRGFFHKLRDRYGFYEGALPAGIDLRKLLIAEYMLSRDNPPLLAEAENAVDTLIEACQTVQRDANGTYHKSTSLTLAGGFIVRFLTQEED